MLSAVYSRFDHNSKGRRPYVSASQPAPGLATICPIPLKYSNVRKFLFTYRYRRRDSRTEAIYRIIVILCDFSIDWLIDWLLDWLIGCSIDWLIDCSLHWLIDFPLIDWLTFSIDWLIDRVTYPNNKLWSLIQPSICCRPNPSVYIMQTITISYTKWSFSSF